MTFAQSSLDVFSQRQVEKEITSKKTFFKLNHHDTFLPKTLDPRSACCHRSRRMPICPEKIKSPGKLFGLNEQPVVPSRMMIIWTDTVLHQPQQPGVRGFGGRIYFYPEQGTEPVAVDGGMAVYAFDAEQLDPELTRPKRKFVFTAEQFSEHMSHTSMGPSYSVWLPWDEVGGFSEQLSLIVRFEGTQGGVVISDPTIKLLPGRDKPVGEKSNADASMPSTGVARAGGVQNDSPGSMKLAGFEDIHPPAKGRGEKRKPSICRPASTGTWMLLYPQIIPIPTSRRVRTSPQRPNSRMCNRICKR